MRAFLTLAASFVVGVMLGIVIAAAVATALDSFQLHPPLPVSR